MEDNDQARKLAGCFVAFAVVAVFGLILLVVLSRIGA